MSDHSVCRACNKKIFDTVVTAGNDKFHQKCFVCSKCSKPFTQSQYITRGNENLCVRCAEGSCFVCNGPLDEYFVKDGKKIHPHCFRCDKCHTSLDGGDYNTFGGKSLCESCYQKDLAAQPQPIAQPKARLPQKAVAEYCARCNKEIEAQSLIVKGVKYHPGCFKCEACGNVIPSGVQFFNVELGRNPAGVMSVLCGSCNGQICPKCQNPILTAEQFVNHGGKRIHNTCLKCVECSLPLNASALYEYDGLLCCEVHYKAYTMGLLKRRPFEKHTK